MRRVFSALEYSVNKLREIERRKYSDNSEENILAFNDLSGMPICIWHSEVFCSFNRN